MPPNFPQTQEMLGLVEDVSAGDVEIALQAKNQSGNDIYLFNAQITAVYVDSSKDGDVSLVSGDSQFGGSWTTLATTSCYLDADDIAILGATTRISEGTPGSNLQLRIVDTSSFPQQVVYVWDEATPDVLTDGFTLARFYSPETTSGQIHSFALQARNVDGIGTTAQSVSFITQAMSEYQLYESDPNASPASITVHGDYHTVVSTQSAYPPTGGDNPSGDSYRSYTFALSTFTPEAVTSGTEEPVRWRIQIVEEGQSKSFHSGLYWGHVENDRQMGGLYTGSCGFCG